jgi:hypothetical protein
VGMQEQSGTSWSISASPSRGPTETQRPQGESFVSLLEQSVDGIHSQHSEKSGILYSTFFEEAVSCAFCHLSRRIAQRAAARPQRLVADCSDAGTACGCGVPNMEPPPPKCLTSAVPANSAPPICPARTTQPTQGPTAGVGTLGSASSASSWVGAPLSAIVWGDVDD